MRDFILQIFDLSPTATPLMEQVNQESEALRAMVETLQTNVEEKQSSLDDLGSRIESQMDTLRAKIEEQQGVVEQEIAEEEQKTEELKRAIEEVKDGVVAALEGAQQQMDDFRGHIDSGREMVESANAAAQAVIGEVHSHVETGRQALHEATDFANEQVDVLQSKIDETMDFTETIATNLIERMDEGIRDTGDKVQEMTGMSFTDMHNVFTTGMELVQGNVIENGVNMALDELQSRIEEQLNQIIDQLLEEMIETLGNVREGLFGNADEASLERQATQLVLDQLENVMDPLFSAVDHIKGMASMVGISV